MVQQMLAHLSSNAHTQLARAHEFKCTHLRAGIWQNPAGTRPNPLHAIQKHQYAAPSAARVAEQQGAAEHYEGRLQDAQAALVCLYYTKKVDTS